MAYEKQTWSCGDTITADKLNYMEDGIAQSGGGSAEPFVFIISGANWPYECDKSFSEIVQAIEDNRPITAYRVGDEKYEANPASFTFSHVYLKNNEQSEPALVVAECVMQDPSSPDYFHNIKYRIYADGIDEDNYEFNFDTGN